MESLVRLQNERLGELTSISVNFQKIEAGCGVMIEGNIVASRHDA